MRVGHRMTRNPLTATPHMALKAASELLQKHRIRHLPVVDRGKLVGIVTDRDIRRALPSDATSLEVHELLYLLDKVEVQEIMTKELTTATPDTPVEEAARLMVEKKIGGLPVLEGERLVGIITETDVLTAFVELMGLRASPARLEVVLEEKPGAFADVCQIIEQQGGDISGFFTARGKYHGEELKVLVLRLEAPDFDELIRAIEGAGHRVLSASL